MMRVAVVDDEPLARRGVIARLAAHPDIVLAGEYADGRQALEGLGREPVDVVFVDVQMPTLDGLSMLAALPAGRQPLSILLTAHDRFALRAFELRAIDYLLKPIDDERFAEALARARQLHHWRMSGADTTGADEAAPDADHTPPPARRFSVRVGRRLTFVEVDEVEWIQADGDYAVLHARGQRHLLRESLQRLATRLDPLRFLRVHRSAIVRVDCVSELQALPNRDALLRLRDGTPLRASRTYIDALLAHLQPAG
ncbi:LytTR family DNA-binding domain-containing protein [Pseudoxanthomonas sp. PXM04]|uniref:LytR/AlgR family response regulator transcription factor n=1 Tax=Pseudoxanthomonas sp. PXM04 TaxID=2769297 RepID=UPI00177FD42B|nr:LytTR family DNA-binding domain-containing protein [Pseudoxanthomonas sp. PXM04]MBD9379060.1 response regulator transcription factor [Pseudoxanthomonas sp. PXM04]